VYRLSEPEAFRWRNRSRRVGGYFDGELRNVSSDHAVGLGVADLFCHIKTKLGGRCLPLNHWRQRVSILFALRLLPVIVFERSRL
jgi:hypothetical protein